MKYLTLFLSGVFASQAFAAEPVAPKLGNFPFDKYLKSPTQSKKLRELVINDLGKNGKSEICPSVNEKSMRHWELTACFSKLIINGLFKNNKCSHSEGIYVVYGAFGKAVANSTRDQNELFESALNKPLLLGFYCYNRLNGIF